jgi:hypothetical protein
VSGIWIERINDDGKRQSCAPRRAFQLMPYIGDRSSIRPRAQGQPDINRHMIANMNERKHNNRTVLVQGIVVIARAVGILGAGRSQSHFINVMIIVMIIVMLVIIMVMGVLLAMLVIVGVNDTSKRSGNRVYGD